MKMKGMINGHGWLGYKSYRKGCFKKKKKKKKSYRKGIEILQKLHFLREKLQFLSILAIFHTLFLLQC